MELNEQSKVGLLLVLPLSILLSYFSEDVVRLFFNSEFVSASEFIDFALLGAIFTVMSNNSGMLIIAKKVSKLYTTISIFHRSILLVIYYVCYQKYGLAGLGLGYLFNGLFQFLLYEIVLFYYF